MGLRKFFFLSNVRTNETRMGKNVTTFVFFFSRFPQRTFSSLLAPIALVVHDATFTRRVSSATTTFMAEPKQQRLRVDRTLLVSVVTRFYSIHFLGFYFFFTYLFFLLAPAVGTSCSVIPSHASSQRSDTFPRPSSPIPRPPSRYTNDFYGDDDDDRMRTSAGIACARTSSSPRRQR